MHPLVDLIILISKLTFLASVLSIVGYQLNKLISDVADSRSAASLIKAQKSAPRKRVIIKHTC